MCCITFFNTENASPALDNCPTYPWTLQPTTVQFPIPYEFLTRVTLKDDEHVFSTVSGGFNICRIVNTMKQCTTDCPYTPDFPVNASVILSNMISAIVYCWDLLSGRVPPLKMTTECSVLKAFLSPSDQVVIEFVGPGFEEIHNINIKQMYKEKGKSVILVI